MGTDKHLLSSADRYPQTDANTALSAGSCCPVPGSSAGGPTVYSIHCTLVGALYLGHDYADLAHSSTGMISPSLSSSFLLLHDGFCVIDQGHKHLGHTLCGEIAQPPQRVCPTAATPPQFDRVVAASLFNLVE